MASAWRGATTRRMIAAARTWGRRGTMACGRARVAPVAEPRNQAVLWSRRRPAGKSVRVLRKDLPGDWPLGDRAHFDRGHRVKTPRRVELRAEAPHHDAPILVLRG